MLSSYRRPLSVLVGAIVAVSALSLPAQGAAEPTTLQIEGTLESVVIDQFGSDAHAEQIYTVVTDDGGRIRVDLEADAASGSRFRGEVVVAGDVASSLRSEDLLPRSGSTIDEDSRAGRVAIAAAEDQTKPLAVASSKVVPVSAAAGPYPAAHKAYVARMTGQGSVDGTDADIRTRIDGMLDYWEAESGGYVTDFRVTDFGDPSNPVKEFASPGVPPSQNCGIGTYDGSSAIWAAAAAQFPGVNFAAPGNHLIVLVGEECVTATGPVGIADVGSSINDGGRSIIVYESSSYRSTGVHEVGHNFGLMHANLLDCPSAAACEYFDLYSPMALALIGPQTFAPPALGTIYRSQLGLLAAGEVGGLALGSGQIGLTRTVALAPRGSTSGPRGLAVRDPYTGVVYSIDWRSPTARDAGVFYGSPYAFAAPLPLFPAGIVVERQASTGYTYLITHPVGGRAVGAFQPGETFAPSAGLAVSVNSIGGAATVTIKLTAPLRRLSAKTPKITGTARIGKTLKVKVGSWSPRPSYSYQWYANGKKITKKGTKSSFKLTSKQKGKRITVRVTGRKAGYVTVTKPSKATKKVAKKK